MVRAFGKKLPSPDLQALQRGLQGMPDALLIKQAREQYRARCVLAREDPTWFSRHVLKDEATGANVTLTGMHEEWHQDLSDHNRLVIWGFVECGKTMNVSVGRSIFEIGNDPTLRVAVISSTGNLAMKIVGLVGTYIATSPEVHDTFPDLKPSTPWTSHALRLANTGTLAKDPNFQALGLFGNILGSRVDLLILDDILNWENTRTEALRQKTIDWLFDTPFSRLSERARVWVLGNAYHPKDALHVLASTPGWESRRYPVLLPNGKSAWPARWSLDRIEQKRLELSGQIGEFGRSMMCVPRSDADSRWKEDWINAAIARGQGREMRHRLDYTPPGTKIVTGVDIGVALHTSGARTVLFTIAVHPNGDREVLEIDAGRWTAMEIVQHIRDVHRRMRSTVFVESNAAQMFLTQFINSSESIPVYPFNTGKNKNDPTFGVESVAGEFQIGKWIIPSGPNGVVTDPIVQQWIQALLFYDPSSHTADEIMAMWIAREGARKSSLVAGSVGRLDLLTR